MTTLSREFYSVLLWGESYKVRVQPFYAANCHISLDSSDSHRLFIHLAGRNGNKRLILVEATRTPGKVDSWDTKGKKKAIKIVDYRTRQTELRNWLTLHKLDEYWQQIDEAVSVFIQPALLEQQKRR